MESPKDQTATVDPLRPACRVVSNMRAEGSSETIANELHATRPDPHIVAWVAAFTPLPFAVARMCATAPLRGARTTSFLRDRFASLRESPHADLARAAKENVAALSKSTRKDDSSRASRGHQPTLECDRAAVFCEILLAALLKLCNAAENFLHVERDCCKRFEFNVEKILKSLGSPGDDWIRCRGIPAVESSVLTNGRYACFFNL